MSDNNEITKTNDLVGGENGSLHPELGASAEEDEQEDMDEQEAAPSFDKMSDVDRRETVRRESSLDLRRLPMEFSMTLMSETEVSGDDDNLDRSARSRNREIGLASGANTIDSQKGGIERFGVCSAFLFCLSPKYTLRSQLMLSFGSVNFLAVVSLVVGCIVVAHLVGQNIKKINQENFEDRLVNSIQSTTVRYLAQSLEQQFMPVDLIDVLEEVAQDRFQGYPDSLDEKTTPFTDAYTGEKVYPIDHDDLFLDWQSPTHVTEDNYREHLQSSQWEGYYKSQAAVSTQNAVFLMQGACDPDEVDPVNGAAYWPNCTSANNNITTGGAIHPLSSTGKIHDMGKDVAPILKAIMEAKSEVRDLGLYFKNQGAGATVNFPAYPLQTQVEYQSVGCDWLLEPNPVDPRSGPIGTREEASRCHKDGEFVSNRLYNPMERGWCRDQALNPKKTFLDSYVGVWSGQWLLSIGRAIYDRQTNEFVACIYMGITLSLVEQRLRDSLLTANSALTVLRFDDVGTVVASTKKGALSGETDSDVYAIDQLHVGLNRESYLELRSLVTFGGKGGLWGDHWNSTEARQKFESFSVNEDGYLVSVAPMPRIPDKYDPDYKPEFIVVMSTSSDDVFAGVVELNEELDDNVAEVFWISLVAGGIALAVTTLMIIIVSTALTSPLRYINDTADSIVRSFGEKKVGEAEAGLADEENHIVGEKKGENYQGKSRKENSSQFLLAKESMLRHWTPRTELSDFLKEFDNMVNNFSGSLMAKSEKGKRLEVRNRFKLRKEFTDLYNSRKDPKFSYRLGTSDKNSEGFSIDNDNSGSVNVSNNSLGFVHTGSNMEESRRMMKESTPSIRHNKRHFSSRLFLWTVVSMVTPLLLTTISISSVVYSLSRANFDQSVENAKQYYLGVKVDALHVHASLRAEYVSSLTAVPVRDIYFLTRYFGWLLFGGLRSAGVLTEVNSVTGQCKNYTNRLHLCPTFNEKYVCDCSWNDRRGNCETFPTGSRHLQLPFFSVERSGSMPDGDRKTTSFPSASYSPETTFWWHDSKSVPGFNKGSNASGYDTLYDRIRVSSAMPLFSALFNYDATKKNFISQFIAFEADGLFLGYSGCGFDEYAYSAWRSTRGNRAAEFRPELCPVGKYGYDPRCRGWYHTGKILATEKNISLHITAPYRFAVQELYGQSGTMPLVDPRTGEFVGQILYDFYSNSVFEALDSNETPLSDTGSPILIAVQGDSEENTVMGPGFDIGVESKRISQVVLPLDYSCSKSSCERNMGRFDLIEGAMKMGTDDVASFTRTSEDGDEETVHVAYAPVNVKSIRATNSSNFGRGVEVEDYLIYSLGLMETEKGLLKPFESIKEKMTRQLNWAIVVLAAGIVASAVFVTYISYLLTVSITEPMLYLLDLIRCINWSTFDGDPPRLEGAKGSSEITKLSDTMLVLFKIVRAANDFFFAGELEVAYAVLVDALRLFKKLGNKKAVAVASNNLANTMLIIYREMQWLGLSEHCGMTKSQILKRATEYYNDSIQLGEVAYEEYYESEGWTPNCLDFMQHLSNRYFNRALFFLTIKNETKKPENIERLGMRDLEIARDMDLEIIEYGEDIGFNRENRAHKLFQANLVRARGHNILLSMGYPDDFMLEKRYPEEWDLNQRLDEIFRLLEKENGQPSSELFTDVNVLGRLQDIETELMKHKMLTGDLETAAKIAIRMLFEDAMIFAEASHMAIQVLLSYVEQMDLNDLGRARVKKELNGYARMLDDDLEGIDEASKVSNRSNSKLSVAGSTLESLSESAVSRISSMVEESQSENLQRTSLINWVKNEVSGGFVTMEDF